MIERGGGFVAKYMRDGVLAYFGHSRADENDAKRAVRGSPWSTQWPGLDTTAGLSLQVRVGIATGLVVVGDLPRVRGLTLMVNSIFNGNRFEDLRIEE